MGQDVSLLYSLRKSLTRNGVLAHYPVLVCILCNDIRTKYTFVTVPDLARVAGPVRSKLRQMSHTIRYRLRYQQSLFRLVDLPLEFL